MNERLQVRILGIVQGVGFRPFVYRLAVELELAGWVNNNDSGVTVEVEGPHHRLLEFLQRLPAEKPAPAYLYAVDHRFLSPAGYQRFEIRNSETGHSLQAWILPDLAVCAECRRELLDEHDRRYRYPFLNCTHCGTRFTIIEDMPYDRPRTAMKQFHMCSACRHEYHNPVDRRFHAQPNACPRCGPQLLFRSRDAGIQASSETALKTAVQWIRDGRILAVKGIGGYHLVVDARNETAVSELRRRKRRQNKPFAVMYPGLSELKRHVVVPSFAEPMLTGAQSPILLLQRTQQGRQEIAASVAPESPYLGVFLPYTPLHVLLLADLGFPAVATSGNITDEPIQFEDTEAAEKLDSLCDAFLIHDRPIVHHADDSVMQIVTRPEPKPQMLRRARGYTPLPILAPRAMPPLLALGGHMNVAFALSREREIILSQHLGDMDTYESRVVYRKTLEDFLRLFRVEPNAIVHDMHPDYFTTQLAAEFELPLIEVQHHHAHLAACMLENQVDSEVLGLTWDGTGYAPDKTVWGGEFLAGTPKEFRRVGSLVPFRLPTGEKGIKESWRTALSLLRETFGPDVPRELPMFRQISAKSADLTLQILEKHLMSPVTTSMGRLFDGVSAILGLSYHNSHQAESAQMLEYAAWEHRGNVRPLPMPVLEGDRFLVDWRETVREVVARLRKGSPVEELAAAFHQALADSAMAVRSRTGHTEIVMSGGVFCNRYLTETMLTRLQDTGLRGIIHSQLPPTDGSLAAGQLWVAASRLD